jgi:hypothetical protein
MTDYAVMFNCLEGGVLEPIEWGPDQLQPDRSIIVLDETSMSLFLWHGKSQGLVARRTAHRQADSLKGHGYNIGQSIIGRDIKEIQEIDDRKVGRVQHDTDLNEEFMELLKKKHNKLDNNIITFDMGVSKVSSRTSKPKPKPKAKPTPKPKEKPKPKVKPAPTPKTKEKPTKKAEKKPKAAKLEKPVVKPISSEKSKDETKMNHKTKAKVAFVLISLLDEFDDIWISRKEDQQFSVEMMDGPICTFSIVEGRIKFTKNSFSGISPDIKTAVQKKFVEFNKLLK